MSLGDERDYGGDGGRSEGLGGSGQTRTRLPESGSGDVYGGGRRPARDLPLPRDSRGRRGPAHRGDRLRQPRRWILAGDRRLEEAGGGSYCGLGGKPVTGQSGGIASGFARTAQGAQSAAANYAVALGSDGMFNEDHAGMPSSASRIDPAVIGELLRRPRQGLRVWASSRTSVFPRTVTRPAGRRSCRELCLSARR